MFGSHLQDIRWQQERIVYGIFLSDHSVLTDVETEMAVLSALMCGRNQRPKIWHLIGLRQLGPTFEDSQKMHEAMKMVARFCGVDTEGWPTPEEVEDQA